MYWWYIYGNGMADYDNVLIFFEFKGQLPCNYGVPGNWYDLFSVEHN